MHSSLTKMFGLIAMVTVWKAAPSRAGAMMNAGFTDLLLGLLALLLLVAAVIDVRTFTISNRLNVAVALLAPLYWWSIGLPLWPDAAIQIGVAAGGVPAARRRLLCRHDGRR